MYQQLELNPKINPGYAARLGTRREPLMAQLPIAPVNASPVPRLTSLYHHTDAGDYGDRSYPGNCGGHLIKDLILYFKSESNYTHIQLQSGKVHLISKTLKTFELKLSKMFLRVHKSYLINSNHMESYSFKDNTLLLNGNMVIPVSRRKKDEVIIFLKSLSI